ncbi:N-acetylmuramoyl-L-alanine amidase [Nonomuraea typhae]|uniref:N-acetylmuramoyl-L-alanine amidase n=1 Tax=Nonomuraea typhae TaxID=2603600 RepID=UPI0012FBBB6C|nr:N-acetylmuramoyl-L-alanine amidase [Nonomuraea typhae]
MRALPATVLALLGLTATACGGVANSDAVGGGAQAGQAQAPAQQTTTPKRAAKALQGKVIVIDPGHNGGNFRDPKAVNRKVNVLTKWKACDTTGTETADRYTEAAFTWDVSNRLAKILKQRGASVKLTRADNTSVGPCITERAAIGNQAKADAALSVHADGAAPGNKGFHVIMPQKIKGPVDPVVGDSKELGLAVRAAFRKGTGLPYSTYIGKDALDFRSDLGGLNLSTVPKVFIECGNMKNAGEAAKFRDPAFRQRIAVALADGLQQYLKA